MSDIKLYNGDCLEVMDNIQDKSIDMILCDLPYGTTNCSWDELIPFDKLWIHYNRIIKDDGVIALFGSEPFSSKLRLSNLNMYKYDWIWEKSKATGFLNSKRRPLVAHEFVHIFYNKSNRYTPQFTNGKSYNKGKRKQQTQDDIYNNFNQVVVKSDGDRYPRSVQYFKTAESEGKTYHKTQKPLSILKYMIKTYTLENQVIVDNTMGSGQTGVACVELNRNFIGVEIDETYFNIAKERIEKAQQNKLDGEVVEENES